MAYWFIIIDWQSKRPYKTHVYPYTEVRHANTEENTLYGNIIYSKFSPLICHTSKSPFSKNTVYCIYVFFRKKMKKKTFLN